MRRRVRAILPRSVLMPVSISRAVLGHKNTNSPMWVLPWIGHSSLSPAGENCAAQKRVVENVNIRPKSHCGKAAPVNQAAEGRCAWARAERHPRTYIAGARDRPNGAQNSVHAMARSVG